MRCDRLVERAQLAVEQADRGDDAAGRCSTMRGAAARRPRTVKSAHSRIARSYAGKIAARQAHACTRRCACAAGALAKARAPMTSELAKTFDPAAIEAQVVRPLGSERPVPPRRGPDAEPFTIVNPPPNVTGILHIGHALDNTLQDVVVRYERLRGKDALWVVGTDHAGIATQMVVERAARSSGRTSAPTTSREDFVAKVWEWKAESGGTITRQLRRLGCSMDWSREQFTMDPHFTRAVIKVFVDLYNQGLIYRDKRLVNWDPKLKTAISDLEVETREVQGHFWHFTLSAGRRCQADGPIISVATTRPETMLADMAVAVHPTDERYADAGRQAEPRCACRSPGREVPIVADEHADPELGTGAVKITPGHDFNDFEVGKRAGLQAGRNAQHARCRRRAWCRPPTA